LRRHERKLKKTEIRISGLGGQGVVLAGQILGRAAVYDGKNVVQTQSYGAEARGSMAKSEVIMSNDKIGFPMVRRYDILVAMNQEALDRNLKDLKQDGMLLVDSTYVKKIPEIRAKIFKISATEQAEKIFGDRIYANMLMLGALTKVTDIVNEKAMKKVIQDIEGKKTAKINKEAYDRGRESVEI
jgi:2-oxoglutarate ferredoxin oxidoreductase subunit gamma